MMKRKITKRDIAFFFLGIITMVVIDLVFNWDENLKSFGEGFKDGIEQSDQ